VKWSESAARDLEQIWKYIAEDSPENASKFVRSLYDASASLGELSGRGRTVPEIDDPAIHKIIIGAYRLLYRVADKAVFILAVVHGAQDFRRLWEQRNA
jgi:plasmid stabilization system protein ParE